VDRNNYWNCHLSTFHKTTNPEEGSRAEDFPEVEDFPVEEDTQVEEEYYLEGCQEEAGDHHHYPCCKPIKENW